MLAAWLLMLSAPLIQTAGNQTYAFGAGSILDATHAQPLARIGGNVVRFSSTPALGGVATVVELHLQRDQAIGSVRTFRGHPQIGWNLTSERRLLIPKVRFLEFAAGVDRQLARGDPQTSGGDLAICTDGPGWFTERRLGDYEQSLSGFCGDDHPNDNIARLIGGIIKPAE